MTIQYVNHSEPGDYELDYDWAPDEHVDGCDCFECFIRLQNVQLENEHLNKADEPIPYELTEQAQDALFLDMVEKEWEIL